MTDYIKKADAYRIAVHGTDPDVAYKIQQLQPEKVVPVDVLTGAEKCDKVEEEE